MFGEVGGWRKKINRLCSTDHFQIKMFRLLFVTVDIANDSCDSC